MRHNSSMNRSLMYATKLAYKGVRVIIAGLDMDFKGIPFGPMPALCAIADDVTKVHAICVNVVHWLMLVTDLLRMSVVFYLENN